jgi:hypothetical protein
MDEDMLENSEDEMEDSGDNTEESENERGHDRMGEDLATLTCPELRARCKERGLRSKGNKANLLVRLRDPEELRPLPQLRDQLREGQWEGSHVLELRGGVETRAPV